MLNFLATTENLRNIRSEQPNYNRGKVIKKTVRNCYSRFPDIIPYSSRADYPEIEGRTIANQEDTN